MRTCWCRAGTTRYWRAPAAGFPGPGRRLGRRSRTARWQRRGGWAPRQARLSGLTRPWALRLPVLVFFGVDAVDEFGEPFRYALVHHLVVHGAELLSETGLHLARQLGRFVVRLLGSGCCGLHHLCLLRRWLATLVHRRSRNAHASIAPLAASPRLVFIQNP